MNNNLSSEQTRQQDHFKGMMQKNQIQSKRSQCFTILEILIPIILIALVSTLSILDTPYIVPPKSQVDEYNTFIKYPDPNLSPTKVFVNIEGVINDLLKGIYKPDLINKVIDGSILDNDRFSNDNISNAIIANLNNERFEELGIDEDQSETLVREIVNNNDFSDGDIISQIIIGDYEDIILEGLTDQDIDPNVLKAIINYQNNGDFSNYGDYGNYGNQRSLNDTYKKYNKIRSLNQDNNLKDEQKQNKSNKTTNLKYNNNYLSFTEKFINDVINGNFKKQFNSKLQYDENEKRLESKFEEIKARNLDQLINIELQNARETIIRKLEEDVDFSAEVNLTSNEQQAFPNKLRFLILQKVEEYIFKDLYEKLREIGITQKKNPILTSFGNLLFLPICYWNSEFNDQGVKYTEDLDTKGWMVPKKGYIQTSNNSTRLALELRRQISNHAIFQEENIIIIDNENDQNNLMANQLNDICFLVELNHLEVQDNSNLNIDQNIRFNNQIIPSTQFNLRPYDNFMDDTFIQQIETGFYNLQSLIDKWFMVKLQPNHPNANLDNVDFMFYSHNRKTTQYKFSIQLLVASVMIPFCIVAAQLVPVVSITNKVMGEKESNVKSGLKLMGCNEVVQWLTWWVHFFLQQMIISAVLTCFLVFFLYTNISVIVMFMVLYLFGCSTVVFVTCLSTLFKRSQIAIMFIMFLYFLTNNLYLLQNESDMNSSSVIIGSILPSLSIHFSFNQLQKMEVGGFKQGIDMLWVRAEGHSLADVLFGQFIAIIFYSFMTLYLDQVVSTTTESAKPWQFIYSYIQELILEQFDKISRTETDDSITKDKITFVQQDFYEPQNDQLKSKINSNQCLRIINLTKKQSKSKDQALKNVHLDIFSDEIFVMLGPNGAGKSTTINILSGKLIQSEGVIKYLNYPDQSEQLKDHRSEIGICPQYNIIFPQLTCQEHLQLFSIFKGIPEEFITDSIAKVNDDLDMSQFMNQQTMNLSGGQQRRVAIAISLLGKGKIIILDEPTAGLDPTSRRQLWHLLKKSKKGKIIIMSTHYMDEAQFLGDRVGILDQGQIQAYGSVNQLRETFAKGTKLEILFSSNESINIFNQQMNELDLKLINSQEKINKIGQLISNNSDLKLILSKLDDDSFNNQYNIHDQNISQSNLDDIFFKIIDNKVDTNEFDDNQQDEEELLKKNLETTDMNIIQLNSEKETANLHDVSVNEEDIKQNDKVESSKKKQLNKINLSYLFIAHFTANFIKRFKYNSKDLFGICCEIFFPLLIILCGMAFSQISVQFQREMPQIPFHPHEITDYGKQRRVDQLRYDQKLFYTSHIENNIQLSSEFENEFFQQLSNLHGGIMPEKITLDKGINNLFESFSDSIRTFDEFLYKILYNTDDQKLTSKDPRPIGHLNLLLNDQVPEFAEIGLPLRTFQMQIVFESTQLHHQPILQNWIHTAYIRAETGNPNVNIQGRNYPLPFLQSQKADQEATPNLAFIGFMNLATSLIGVGVMQFLMSEKESQMKDLIQLSGIHIHTYWISNQVQDIIKQIIFYILTMLIIYLQDQSEIITEEMGKGPVFAIGFLMTGFSIIQCVQFFTLMFEQTGYSMVFILIFLSTISTVMQSIYEVMNQDTIRMSTSNAIDQFWFLFLVNPNFIFMQFISMIFKVKRPDQFNFYNIQTAWDNRVIRWIQLSIVCGGFQFMATMIVEQSQISSMFKRKIELNNEEEQYQNSETQNQQNIDNRIDFDPENDEDEGKRNVIVGKNLIKYQGKDNYFSNMIDYTDSKLALKNVSFKVNEGECYVLLGSNGAGKSTLFKLMMSQIQPTSGSVAINGLKVNMTNIAKIREKVGQCPQNNSFYDHLTVREHLEYIIAIKNINQDQGEFLIKKKLNQLLLMKYEHQEAHTLSGGNQRKLNQAIASLTNPELMFLDEPTSSMDPVARKMINKNILENKRATHNIFQCTHIIDEAEYVSDKIAILINGRIRTIGNSIDLKNKFGQFYVVQVTIDTDNVNQVSLDESDNENLLNSDVANNDDISSINLKKTEYIANQIKNKFEIDMEGLIINIDNISNGNIKYTILKNNLKLSRLCTVFNEFLDEQQQVIDFSMDSMNLEEIFWNLNREESNE